MIHTSIDNKKFVFVGCSLTLGEGLDGEKDSISNYANIVSKKYNSTPLNLSKKGNSNIEIFNTSMNQLLFSDMDVIFVQWTVLRRYWCYPDPYAPLFIFPLLEEEIQIRDLYFSKKEIKKFTELFYLLHHDYQAIVNVINYSKILSELAKIKNVKIIFINGSLLWNLDIYHNISLDNMFKNLSNTTKDLLDFDNRSDYQVQELYTKLHNLVIELDENEWVSMFEPLALFKKIDIGTDNMHPGTKSHQLYADMIIKYLEENNG